MSLESWIIEELERERRREERAPCVLELPLEDGELRPVPREQEPATRGVEIVDISPTHDNVIQI